MHQNYLHVIMKNIRNTSITIPNYISVILNIENTTLKVDVHDSVIPYDVYMYGGSNAKSSIKQMSNTYWSEMQSEKIVNVDEEDDILFAN